MSPFACCRLATIDAGGCPFFSDMPSLCVKFVLESRSSIRSDVSLDVDYTVGAFIKSSENPRFFLGKFSERVVQLLWAKV